MRNFLLVVPLCVVAVPAFGEADGSAPQTGTPSKPLAAVPQATEGFTTTAEVTLGLELTSFENEPARREGVRTPDLGFAFAYEMRFFHLLAAAVGGGLGGTKDEKQFSQSTTGGTLPSSLLLHHWWLGVGASTPAVHYGDKLGGTEGAMRVLAGIDGQWGRRTIDDCSDCRTESLNLDAGWFVEPALELSWGIAGVGFSYRRYFGDTDTRDRFTLNLLIGSRTTVDLVAGPG
jgi:hypothetical protein